MEAKHDMFCAFLEGHDKHFIIPVYQRNYDWRYEHCQQLFDDMLSIIREEQYSYFMGSVVSILADGHGTERVIIDGQQRITTLSIFLLAIRNLLQARKITSDDSNLHDKINDSYLRDKYNDENDRIRLKPVKDDNEAFQKLFEDSADNHIQGSNITENYYFFERKILETTQNGTKVDDLYSAFKKLMIVDIKLDREKDKPQLVFESLNSTGKKLDESDLIRNFILMNKKPTEQERIYETYWHPIEKNTHYNVSDFIRDYLTNELGKTPKKDGVYREFRRFLQNQEQTPNFEENLLKRLFIFSNYYKEIRFSEVSVPEINAVIKNINHLEIGVSYPYLLDLFHMWQGKKIIGEGEVAEILSWIEAFAFRRTLCEIPTNALNKIFAVLGKNIRQNKGANDRYIDVFIYHLLNGNGNMRFPSSEEFEKSLMNRDIYNMSNKHRIHLFKRLEHFENKERVDIENGDFSTEHIMPQKLSSQWETELGENYKVIYDEYLHKLGNLTLTAYNPKYQNKPFLEKRNMEKGYRDSSLWLNKSLHEIERWTEEEITSRGNMLAERALKIWRRPETDYLPDHQTHIPRSIYDEFNFTGTKPVEAVFIGEREALTSWKDLYLWVVQMIFDLDTTYFMRLAEQEGKNAILSKEKNELSAPEEVRNGIFFETNMSAEVIISRLKLFFEDNNLEEDDFEVTVRPA